METRNDNTGGSSHEVNANMETQGKRSYRSHDGQGGNGR